MLNDAIDFTKIHRVLVVKLRHHGDVLLTSPVFSVLMNHYPHLQVDALVYKETQEMLSCHPAIDRLYVIDRGWKKKGLQHLVAQEWSLLKRLKARQYDLLILLTEQWRGAFLKRLLSIPYAVVADYGRRQSVFWKSSFSHIYPETLRRHKVEFHLDALRRLGLQPRSDEKKLMLAVPEPDQDKVSGILEEKNIRSGFIVLHPASRWFYKCWEAEKYAALIDELHEKGHIVAITGAPSPEEDRLISEIKAAVRNPPIDLSGQLSLKQLGELIRRASCFIGVDSVPMHIAAAMGTPLVALFGPSSQYMWRPWTNTYEIVSLKPSCQPCFQHGCGNSEFSECISNIDVMTVYRAVERMICACHDRIAVSSASADGVSGSYIG